MKEVMRSRHSGSRASTHHTAAAIILAIATVTALSACVDARPTPTPTSTASIDGGTTEQDNLNEEPHDDGEVSAAPEAGGDSQAGALEAATAALEAFARPGLDYDTWWAELLPHLTQQAGVAYEGTDPAQIPVRQVTGAGTVLEGSTEVSLIVQLPTDAGPYNITLTRAGGDAPWLADRIRPAQG
ncbi:hypothetical protein [Microbacterium sp. IO18]|uniref:hypothetical protein n=1 Tax=Microbacterium sp. IO18 TaxID=3390997 RepID=UPI003BA37AF0